MKIDKTVMILVIVLLFVLGIFALSQIGGSEAITGEASRSVGYASQYAGGGCSR